ncbi:hypothetical protein [Actinomadura latina]|uniref:ATP-binding protein n=1 Tax=Actinomadura latina TaxID=163603 RepID=A0A846YVT2_9ACTN|nr:hypothetical protein [Actinomadura latina]NKZ04191.1 hypothetical protein [Actinomadura latina]
MIVWERRDARLSSSAGLGVRDVRAYVRGTLEGADHSFDLDDVDLMVCEIATNAVRHVRHEVAHFEWLRRSEVVMVT